jgi:ribosomal protein L24
MVDPGKAITLVPEEECNQLIRMPSIPNAMVKGGWARIKRGHYKGDVAFVTAVKDDNVRVLVVPRILYDVCPAWTRAPPALFDADRARTIFGQDAVRQLNRDSDERYTFQQMTFKAGLLEQVFGMKELTSEDVYPTLEEIQLFSQSSGWDRGARDAWEANRAAAALRERDRVQILSGEFRGALGIVVNKRSDSVQIQLSHHDGNVLDEDFRLELSVDQVRRFFKPGDYVRIREGAHAVRYGYVVKTVTKGIGLLELVEWDKSQPFTPVSSRTPQICSTLSGAQTYEPNPRQHLSVYAHSVDFAEESICFASDLDRDELEPKTHTASVIARASGDPISLAGRRVVVVKTNIFRGYRGVIQYTHKVHKFFGVRLDATNKIVHLPEEFLVDQL